MTASAPTNRLSYDDDLFLRIHRALGTPLVNQLAWRFDAPLDPAEVQRLHDGLSRGPLARRVVPGAVPGARDRWVRSSHTVPVRFDDDAIEPGAVVDWLAARAAVDLDPYDGPAWALAAAPTTDGGAVLSFAASHVVADGGAIIAALIAAIDGTPIGRLPVDDLSAVQVTIADEWRDAWHEVRRAARGLRAARRQPKPAEPAVAAQRSVDKPTAAARPDDALPAEGATVFVDCPAAQWHAAARAADGTANSLMLAIVAEILLACGGAESGRPIEVGVSVSARTGTGDLRANATTGTAIVVDTELRDGVGVVTDLAHIRQRSRAEFAAMAAGTRPDALEPLKPLLQLVPDGLAKLAAANAAAPLAFASNLGRCDERLAAPFGVPARSIAMRAVTRNATRGMLRRMRGGVSAWWNESGERCTLAVLGLDQDAFPDRATLLAAVARVYERWGLTPEPW